MIMASNGYDLYQIQHDKRLLLFEYSVRGPLTFQFFHSHSFRRPNSQRLVHSNNELQIIEGVYCQRFSNIIIRYQVFSARYRQKLSSVRVECSVSVDIVE